MATRLTLYAFFLSCYILLQAVPARVIAQQPSKPLSVLVLTGGHDFERSAFFGMMESLDGISWTEAKHPEARRLFATGEASNYDVLLFYDMVQEIQADEQAGLKAVVDAGVGLVFLHHSLVSYRHWDQYRDWVGGRYFEQAEGSLPPSNYQHEVHFRAIVEPSSHPVTDGVADFDVFDETYGNVYISPKVIPLIGTDHPNSMPLLAWSQELGKSRSVYIQPGHGPEVFDSLSYRKLLQQAVQWVAKR